MKHGRRPIRYTTSVLVVAAVGTVIWVNAGSLTPPAGPVAPTMKTLVEVEPRINVQSLAGSGSALHVITQGGAYYLTDNVIGSSGLNGIEIQADDVTLDLNGMVVAGVAGSLAGVKVTTPVRNLAISNGGVQGWGGHGVDAANATAGQISGLRVGDNQQDGVRAGEHASVHQVASSGNGGAGIAAGQASLVRDCTVSTNGQDGISAGAGSLVSGCVCTGNGAAGVSVSDGARVVGTVSWSDASGIEAVGDMNRIEDNHVSDAAGDGMVIGGEGNLIVRNNVRGSGGLNYNIAAGNDYAKILLAPGGDFSSSEAWANFGDGCPIGLTLCGGNCVDLNSDVNHCSACGVVCPSGAPNTFSACVNAACELFCSPGYADCNASMGDGCEAHLVADPNHCGACNTVCTPVPNANSLCVNSACMLQCHPGFGNCNGNFNDGCEVNFNSNVNNCGGCGVVCPPRPNAIPVCNAGSCSFVCHGGFANCNGNPVDGCEVNLTNDENNCGACGNQCPQFFSCVGGACQ